MTLANRLTLIRVFLTVVFIGLMQLDASWSGASALAVFVIAGLTDAIDGRIARATGTVTRLGALMDPLADKVLMMSAFILLAESRLIPGWIVAVIVAREFAVSGLRMLALDNGVALNSDHFGKVKTILQFVTICLLLGAVALNWGDKSEWAAWARVVLNCAIWGCLLTAALSGFNYFYKNRKLFQVE